MGNLYIILTIYTAEYNKVKSKIKAKSKKVLENLKIETARVIRNRYQNTQKTRATLEESKEELTRIFAYVVQNSAIHNNTAKDQPVRHQAELLESRLEAIDNTTKRQVTTLRSSYRQKINHLRNTELDVTGFNFEADPGNIKTRLIRLNGECKRECRQLENEHKEKLEMLEDQLKLTLQVAREIKDSCRQHTCTDSQTLDGNTNTRQATETLQHMSRQIIAASADPMRTQDLVQVPVAGGTQEYPDTQQMITEPSTKVLDTSVDETQESISPLATQQMTVDPLPQAELPAQINSPQDTQQMTEELPAQGLESSMGELQESPATQQMITEPSAQVLESSMGETQGSIPPLATQQTTAEPPAQSIPPPATQQMTAELPAQSIPSLATQQMTVEPPAQTIPFLATQQMTAEPPAQVLQNSTGETQDTIPLTELHNTTVAPRETDVQVPATTQASSSTGPDQPNTSNPNTLEDRIKSLEQRQERTENVLAAACCASVGGIGLVVLGPTVTTGCVIGLCCFGVCWYIFRKRK